MSRSFPIKPLQLLLGMAFGFSGSLWAAELSLGDPNLSCTAPQPRKHLIAPAKTDGGAALAPDVTRVNADRINGQSQVKVRAEGDVVFERNQQILNADWVEYDQPAATARAGERFTLSDGTSQIQGQNLTYQLDSKQGQASRAVFETEQDGRRLQGVGAEVEMHGDKRYRLKQTQFNTCNPGDDSWYIRASSIDADYNQNIGVARDATLVFKGVPILYSPWLDFPLNGSRKSGFLAPTISTGSNGFELKTPYYLNLAANYDATITPHLMTERGLGIGGEFRYLQPNYNGQIRGEWLPNDRQSERNNRYELSYQHGQRFSGSLSGGIDYNQVSDNDYYASFGSRSQIATQVNLNRQAWLNHNTDLFGGNLNNFLTVQKYQTLQNNDGSTVEEPYALMPRLSSTWQKNYGPASAEVFGQITRFEHDTKQTGTRAVLYPSVQWHFANQWGFVHPKLGLHLTRYQLDGFNGTAAHAATRSLPIVSVDSGLTFEREFRLRNQGYVQTLEPRLFYTYIPTKNQSDLPNFDASENSFTFGQLFRENRFAGQDRISSANHLTTALTTRFLDDQTGEERLRAGIGQRFYFKKDIVTLGGQVENLQRARSDTLAFVGGQLSQSIGVDADWHYNQNLNTTENLSAAIRYRPEPGKAVSLRYKYGRQDEIYSGHYGKLSQMDLAWQWPVYQNYSAVGRFNYALSHHRPLDQMLGIEYSSPCRCWSASVVGQHYVSGVNKSKNAVFFQLQLRDLSSLGNNPLQQLRSAIPGYSPIHEVYRQK